MSLSGLINDQTETPVYRGGSEVDATGGQVNCVFYSTRLEFVIKIPGRGSWPSRYKAKTSKSRSLAEYLHKRGQIDPNEGKYGIFTDQISVHFGSRSLSLSRHAAA